MANPNESFILNVSNLSTYLSTYAGKLKAVDNVTFNIQNKEIHALVGESGSGKTMTALSIFRVVPMNARIVSGEIVFEGEDLVLKSEGEMRSIRGRRISMVFQDPSANLNPIMKIQDHMTNVIKAHQGKISREDIYQRITNLLKSVGIADPEVRMNQYPFQMSGGMKQRVIIATALANDPSLLVADEPTTNLDVSIQAQILELIKRTRDKFNASVLLITHNLGIVAHLCDKVTVMYAGQVVETGSTDQIFTRALHPYTILLLLSVPKIKVDRERLYSIRGDPPNPVSPPSGCRFHPRCLRASSICSEHEPRLVEHDPGHLASCHHSGPAKE